MKVIICIKQVPDPAAVEVDPETGVIDEERLLYMTNPLDLCAVEEAVQLKEKRGEGEIIAISLGPPAAEKALRDCLARGADRAVRVWDEALEQWNPHITALVLAKAIRREKYDLILCGAASADEGSGQVGPAIAEILGLPQASGIVSLELSPDGRKAKVRRKLGRGEQEIVECSLPALFTVEAMSTPRYPSLPAYMEALRAPIHQESFHSLGITNHSQSLLLSSLKLIGTMPPRPRPRKIFTPDSKLPAFQRIGLILSGGAAVKKPRIIKTNPQESAEEIIRFLQDKGILGSHFRHSEKD